MVFWKNVHKVLAQKAAPRTQRFGGLLDQGVDGATRLVAQMDVVLGEDATDLAAVREVAAVPPTALCFALKKG